MNKYEFKRKLANKGVKTEGEFTVWFNDSIGSNTMDVWRNVSAAVALGKAATAYVYPNPVTCHTYQNGTFLKTDVSASAHLGY